LSFCADRLTVLYGGLVSEYAAGEARSLDPWDALLRRLQIEWNLLVEKTAALSAAVVETAVTGAKLK
jgi:hypothetical protein